MFLYPNFNKNGEKVIARIGGENKEMLMDISVFQLKRGQKKYFFQENKEVAILLIDGSIKITAGDIDE
ncbi:5-deoxyglucuronate isomerase, partial [bacterium]|nr:5-deoxyglucuronate isomerase [bacterium]